MQVAPVIVAYVISVVGAQPSVVKFEQLLAFTVATAALMEE